MDISITILGGVIILLCALPFILMKRNKNKREGELLKSINKLAVDYDGEIHHYEVNSDFAIGVDEIKDHVFFCRHIKNDAIEEKYIDLYQFKTCKATKVSTAEGQIDRLSISFIPNDSSKANYELEFYNTDFNLQLNGELQFIEKWAEFINNRIKLIVK